MSNQPSDSKVSSVQQKVSRLIKLCEGLIGEGRYEQAAEFAHNAYILSQDALPANDPLFAIALHNLAVLYQETGRYAEAEPLHRKALDLSLNTYGENHQAVAQSLDNLARLYVETGDHASAEPLMRRALEIRQAVLGPSHAEVARSLDGLGQLSHAQGEYSAAETFYKQALEIRQDIMGMDLAATTNNLGLLYHARGRYAEAEPLLKQAHRIISTVHSKNHPTSVTVLNNLAILYGVMGKYAEVEQLTKEVMEICRTFEGERSERFATALNTLAVLYENTGNYRGAVSLHRKALEIWRSIVGKRHPKFAISLNNLAKVYFLMGSYRDAEKLMQEALEIRRATLGEEHPEYANSLNSLAELYRDMHDYTAAKALYRQALKIRHRVLGEDHPDFARSLNNLAHTYEAEGNYEAALPLYQQVQEIRRNTLGENHPEYVHTLNTQAAHYLKAGKYKQAEHFFRYALETCQQVLGTKHPEYAQALSALALLYWSMGEYLKAEPLYLKVLEIRRMTLGGHHPDYAAALEDLAMLYCATNRVDKALVVMQQAAAIDDRIIGQILSIGSERHRMSYLQTVQTRVEMFLSLITEHHSQSQPAIHAALELILKRKAIMAEVSAAQRDAVLGGRYPELKNRLDEITALRNRIAQKTLAGPRNENLTEHRTLLADLKAEKERLEADLTRKIPEMNIEERIRSSDRKAVSRALPEGALLLEFVRFNVFNFRAVPARNEPLLRSARYVVFVLSSSDPDDVRMIDLGEVEGIDNKVAIFREAIINGEDINQEGHDFHAAPVPVGQTLFEIAGHNLRKAVFDPILPALRENKCLLFCPEGDLSRLPFEVLPTEAGRFLIDEYQISYLGTGRDVLRFGFDMGGLPAKSVVIADPNFDLGNGQPSTQLDSVESSRMRGILPDNIYFPPLPGTRVEGEQIAVILGAQLWTSDAALESHVKSCRSPRVLHLATHGFFLEDKKASNDERFRDLGVIIAGGQEDRNLSASQVENPLLRSGLALAGANFWYRQDKLPVEAEDGILTAEDVLGLDLLGTELVVLSACETGLGEVRVGEGVFGLRRSFVLAGAKTLVMSLWKVPDEQTQALMVEFYMRINEGQPLAAALRAAQLKLKEKHPQPLYWGAFICQGDPRAVLRLRDGGVQS